jgi:hypothetical protein
MAKMHEIASVEFVKESNPNAPSLLIKKGHRRMKSYAVPF